MFKFLKDKLKKTVERFTNNVDDEAEVVEIEEKIEESNVEKIDLNSGGQNKIDKEIVNSSDKKTIKKEKIIPSIKKTVSEKSVNEKSSLELDNSEIGSKEESKGFFQKLVSKKLSENKFDDLFWELEIVLLENNVSVKVIEKIKTDLKEVLVNKSVKRNKLLDIIKETLRKSISEILSFEELNFIEKINSKKPFIICFLGINGSGKTTTIAKVANLLLKNNKTVILAAADTFRAAAIDQLQEHADKLGIKLIKQDYGSDPAAVAFDAVKHAEAKEIDVVLVDTAGRMHSNLNLLEEMKKIIRVTNPDLKIFVGESITGNDCVEQAQNFNQSAGIDGIILSKADIDEKGGAAISVSYVTKKPILFLGVGQDYEDLEVFNKNKILDKLDL